MSPEQFQQVLQHRLSEIQRVLGLKGQEYASEADRLHHFKVAGALQGCTPERALQGMLAKHLVSVLDIIRGLDSGIVPDVPTINEKLGDCQNYFILLEGLLLERLAA